MRFIYVPRIIFLVSPAPVVLATNKWSDCQQKVLQIQAGELTLGSINNETLNEFLYHGPVTGLDRNFPRDKYLAVTYEGCEAICGNPVATYDAPEALSLAANWIFPLAILLNLPYESLHERKISKTLVAVLNWLGSPQTALTATIFNFRQLRESHRRVQRRVNAAQSHLYSAAYFVMCCMNQYDGLALVENNGDPAHMLNILVYGLFRPLSGDQSPDVDLTRQLLVTLAFQLRMLRRRGVIPMLANLGTFLIAFIFSVVLAFAELGDNNTPFSLAFGLLMTWLPLLVVFTIIDRNPVSSERVRELISRWLYNVEAVKTWASEPVNDPNNIEWWQDNTEIPQALKIDVFIGQGRKIQFCGLPHALLETSATVDFHTEKDLSGCAERAANRLKGWKPKAWYVVAILSFLLVWCAIMSAFVVSFTAPTIGLGCRSLTYLLFGAFSSVSWVIQFSKRPPQWALWVSYISNTLAILTLLVVIVFQVTGVASNCYCKSSALNAPFLGGYLDFEGPAFYRDHFNVLQYWAAAAVIGGSVPTIPFIVALFWWLKCRHLWQANEGWQPQGPRGIPADTRWLL
ncbi:Uncharacterized protein HZ326_22694 [Fusarium oxysporum f. sp. albedinis]|nr:hypothetical protein FOMA001_g5822 [Fusarium oxysporum f. sp. matthiolae]KAJ0134233.1 Uncharacterized protein HZ326_22694 [Fusarium oxysporum f. sp. albedinis]KAK2484290.1 hypothetical protein H9L39_06082 [Fusarium oxysporum f. sp. albedinis]